MKSGLFCLCIHNGLLSAFLEGDKPTKYLEVSPGVLIPRFFRLESIQFRKGRIDCYYVLLNKNISQITLTTSNSATVQLLKLDPDGGVLEFMVGKLEKIGDKFIHFAMN